MSGANHPTPEKLTVTDAQGRVLQEIERRGHPNHGVRSNGGGAINRMIERMRALGWIEGYFHLTEKGTSALRVYWQRVASREARFLRRGGLR